jgi:hypothetical protein
MIAIFPKLCDFCYEYDPAEVSFAVETCPQKLHAEVKKPIYFFIYDEKVSKEKKNGPVVWRVSHN